MSFLSPAWLAWMAGTVLAFWLCPAAWRFRLLAATTLAFLVWADWRSAVALALLTGTTWLLARGASLDGRRTLLALLPGLTLLFGFKLWSAGAGDDLFVATLIPLGLSYYSLRAMHFVLERYKGAIGETSLQSFAEYLFFLPTVVIGPIHRYPAFERDRRRHRWDQGLFSEGLERILYGYVKIAVLGNFLVSQVFAEWAAEVTAPDTPLALYLLMVEIGFNLYFQFSGYSDIAIGFARLLGLRVMENFRWPFLQKNISDFWRAWHISLTSWSREYVHGGVVALTRRPALGVLATLVAIGLWHEISLRYLAWGLYHGLGIVVWQRLQPLWRYLPAVRVRPLRLLLDLGSILLTLHFVLLGFLLVRQPDLEAMAATAGRLLFGWI